MPEVSARGECLENRAEPEFKKDADLRVKMKMRNQDYSVECAECIQCIAVGDIDSGCGFAGEDTVVFEQGNGLADRDDGNAVLFAKVFQRTEEIPVFEFPDNDVGSDFIGTVPPSIKLFSQIIRKLKQ